MHLLTYAITMTFVCGMVFGVLLTLVIAELIRRHQVETERRQAIHPSGRDKDPFNMQTYQPANN